MKAMYAALAVVALWLVLPVAIFGRAALDIETLIQIVPRAKLALAFAIAVIGSALIFLTIGAGNAQDR